MKYLNNAIDGPSGSLVALLILFTWAKFTHVNKATSVTSRQVARQIAVALQPVGNHVQIVMRSITDFTDISARMTLPSGCIALYTSTCSAVHKTDASICEAGGERP